jgi:hypothetical protein
MAIKTFTTGEVLTAADTNTYLANSGLTYITSANVPTSPAASSLTVSNCFSSTYDNYRIIIAGVTSGLVDFTIQLTGITGSVYVCQGTYQLSGVSTVNPYAATSTTLPLGTFAATGNNFVQLELSSPNLAKIKYAYMTSNSNLLSSQQGGLVNSTVQSTGFTVAVASGNISGGTVTVYGYRKA